MAYRFLGVEFLLDPYRRPAEAIAAELRIESRGWPALSRAEVFRAAPPSSGQRTTLVEQKRRELAQRLLLLCSLLRSARRVEASIAEWLASHPIDAVRVRGPLELFRRTSGVETDFDLDERIQTSIKNALWKSVDDWNRLPDESPDVDVGDNGSSLRERVAREQRNLQRRAEQRAARHAVATDLESQARESISSLNQSLTRELGCLSADGRGWVELEFMETNSGAPEVHVELRRRTGAPIRLEASVRRTRGRCGFSLRVTGANRKSKEHTFETDEQLSEEIHACVARHVAKQTAALAPAAMVEERTRDQVADTSAVQALLGLAMKCLTGEVEDEDGCIADGEAHESFVVVVPSFEDDDPVARIPVSVQRLHPGPAGVRFAVNGEASESLNAAKKALKVLLGSALEARRAMDQCGNRTYDEGAAKGGSWGRGCSIREAKRFLEAYGERDKTGDVSAEGIFDAIFPDAGWPWPDHVEPRQDEIDDAEFQAEQELAEFWDVDPDESGQLGRIPDEYLCGFVEGARQAIRERREDDRARKRHGK